MDRQSAVTLLFYWTTRVLFYLIFAVLRFRQRPSTETRARLPCASWKHWNSLKNIQWRDTYSSFKPFIFVDGDKNVKFEPSGWNFPSILTFLHIDIPDLQPWVTSLIFLRWPASTSPSWRRQRRRRKIPCPQKKVRLSNIRFPFLIWKHFAVHLSPSGIWRPLSFLPCSHRTGESFVVKPLPSCTVHPLTPALPCFQSLLLAV